MTFLWLSRALYAYLVADRARLTDQLTQAHQRIDHLVDTLVAAQAPVVRPPPKEPDLVTHAIIRMAGTDRALRKHYFEYVNQQRALGVDDAKIALAITQGEHDDLWVPV